MHILVAFLTAVAGLIWALYRLQNSGVDLNAFNPFYWMHRRKWQKKYGTKAIHQLDSPMDAAALLIVATAKLDGDITREQKQSILLLFTEEFKLPSDQANSLYASSGYLLKEVINPTLEVPHILAPVIEQFSESQTQSLLNMLNATAKAEGSISKEQEELIQAVEIALKKKAQNTQWQ